MASFPTLELKGVGARLSSALLRTKMCTLNTRVYSKKRCLNHVTVSHQVMLEGLSDNGRVCGGFVVDSPAGIS